MASHGERIGPFDLQEMLAVRPRSDLWRAVRADDQGRGPRDVVLRLAHEATDSEAVSELRKEYDALRAIDDPRVRKAWGFYPGLGALALEYIDGVSLAWVLHQAAQRALDFDLATRVDVLVELANALRVTHEAGVVHGCLCADTVRLRRDGNIVIADFALPVDRLAVVPPEIAAGTAVSTQTDQWLLGALAVHLLLGETLLGGEPGSPADGRRDLGAWLARVEAISPRMARVTAKLLARDPRDRYDSEGLLVKDLLSALREASEPPRRDLLARKAHLRRPQGQVAPVVRVPRGAARPVAKDTRTAPIGEPPPPRAPVPSPAPPVAAAEANSVDLRPPTPAPWKPRAVSFESSHRLVDAVVDEDDAVTTPRSTPPPQQDDDVAEDEAKPAPAAQRMVPDWVAAWALVVLLAVGLWAVVTRIF
ncbi:MAG: protein kinase [Deltaproteobacteria bacterium]|nr:protein kinase [Deltaproteobacteria bacterium]